MGDVNESDLKRFGITREQWAERQQRIEEMDILEVRLDGGAEVLRRALISFGVTDFVIGTPCPAGWANT